MTFPLAVVVNADARTYSVKTIAVPQHRPDEILVKVHAAAQNPADWKGLEAGQVAEGCVVGGEFSGVVAEVGTQVTKVKKGDKIASYVHGQHPGDGAYSQLLRADGRNLLRVPEDLPLDQAAAYPAGFQTAALGLYDALNIPRPYTTPDASATPILVWGGSTSVGSMVIQLAKLAGLTVITTGSPRNHVYLKSLGADHILSYSDPNTPAEIKKITNNKLYLAFDNISENGTTQAIVDSMGSDANIPEGKKKEVVLLLQVPRESLDEKAKDVVFHTLAGYSLILKEEAKVWGRVLQPDKARFEFAIQSYELLERLLADKKLQHPRVKVFGGLEAVPEGFAYMKAGKVSGEKIIYHPQETKL